MRLPDGRRSQAVLIGTSAYSEAELTDLPAVTNNLHDLAEVVKSDRGLGFPSANCETLLNPDTLDSVMTPLHIAASSAEDLLLVYYAGHGLLDEGGRLFLSLPETPRPPLFWRALDVAGVCQIVAKSRATHRVLILDCCFSGRAIEAMSGGAAEQAIPQLEVGGTYTLTSTAENMPAHAPEGARYTTFTGALLDLFKGGVPGGPERLTLDNIYDHLRRVLRAQSAPEPRRRCTDDTGNLGFIKNLAPAPSRFDELSKHAAYPMIRSLVGGYVRRCIPDPLTTQKERWNVSALPSTAKANGSHRLLTVNCGPQEVLYVSEVTRPNGARHIIVICNIAPPAKGWISELTFAEGNVTGRPWKYRRNVWAWQFDLVGNLAELRGPISTTQFETLARQLNVELMESKSPYARYHDAELAADLLTVGAQGPSEKNLFFDALHIVVDLRDVELGDIAPTLRTLQRLTETPDVARAAQGTLDLRIDGYNDTPQELFEIEEVRAFIHSLDKEFPFWLFFSSTHTSSLQMIAMCFLTPSLTHEEKRQQFGTDFGKLLTERWIPALNAMAAFAQLDEAELRERSDESLGYFVGPRIELHF
ncbi:caspase domain-containing protein [Nocardia sp. NPDC052316]|uniref:caspase domain-containing protein n=1 Tax=Nocardia sp. NPDC052316 TaxID=3364329 RepID=UPI0037C7A6D9